MTQFVVYPGLDNDYQFPAPVRQAFAASPEFATAVQSAQKSSAFGLVDILNPITGDPIVDDLNLMTTDIPTVTYNIGATTLAGSALTAALRVGNVNTGEIDQANDTHFRYDGAPHITPVAALNSYAAPQFLTDGSSQAAYYTPSYEFVTSASNSQFELLVRPASTAFIFRLEVDGEWMSGPATTIPGLTAGSGTFVKFDFNGVAKSRHLKFQILGATGFRGVQLLPGDTISRPPDTSPKLRVAILGDSYTGGVSSPPNGAYRIEVWANWVARVMGADSVWNFGVGGSGYTVPGIFANRVPDILACNPNAVLIMGSRNDGSDPGVPAAVANVLSGLASVPFIAVSGPSTAGYETANAQIKTATEAAGRVFLDGLSEHWITSADLGSDGIHPTFVGHQKIARGFWKDLRSHWLLRNLYPQNS